MSRVIHMVDVTQATLTKCGQWNHLCEAVTNQKKIVTCPACQVQQEELFTVTADA